MLVTIKTVAAAFPAVGDVDIGPAVTIEIDDGDGRAHGCDLRHDSRELRVECRRPMHKINTCLPRYFFQVETMPGERCVFIELNGLPGGDAPNDGGRS